MPLDSGNLFNLHTLIEFDCNAQIKNADSTADSTDRRPGKLTSWLTALRSEYIATELDRVELHQVAAIYRNPQRWLPSLNISSVQLADVRLTIRILLYGWITQYIKDCNDPKSDPKLRIDAENDLFQGARGGAREYLERNLARMPEKICIMPHLFYSLVLFMDLMNLIVIPVNIYTHLVLFRRLPHEEHGRALVESGIFQIMWFGAWALLRSAVRENQDDHGLFNLFRAPQLIDAVCHQIAGKILAPPPASQALVGATETQAASLCLRR